MQILSQINDNVENRYLLNLNRGFYVTLYYMWNYIKICELEVYMYMFFSFLQPPSWANKQTESVSAAMQTGPLKVPWRQTEPHGGAEPSPFTG